MASKKKQPVKVITSFKGFNKDWQCRGFQFELGKTYEHEGKVEACASGFHACEHPLDVFGYYAPAGSRFALVEQSGELSRESGDSKVASQKMTVKAELSIAGLVKAAIEYTSSRCKPVDPESPASSTGDRGAASSTGNQGAASSTGNRGAASSTGDYGAASSTGKHSVALAAGIQGKAMASTGSAIVLCYRDEESEGDDYGRILHIKAGIAGQDGIKPDAWYQLNADGEFVEVE